MSNYTKSTNFAIKDSLVTTDPAKVIKGTDIDNEYNAISNAIASKADVNSPALTGTPTVPTATAGTNTTQIASCAFAIANGIPSGCIVIWSGSVASIPSGWVLCNGSSGTPDLRNRFVVGAGSTYAVGDTGGSANAIVVAHTHSITDSGHTHTYSKSKWSGEYNQLGGASPSNPNNFNAFDTTNTSSATTGISINSTGDSATNANLPPYYALAYIMKS